MADHSAPNSPTSPTTPITPITPTTPGYEVPRAPSVSGISSRMTDIASEDGISSQPPPSRRGPPPARSSVGNATMARPGSSSSRMSRMSRTHVPSLTPQAFFRPMSSQRLQAHRRPSQALSGTGTVASEDIEDEENLHRRSIVSSSTLRLGAQAIDAEIPPSRGTEFTDPIIPDRNTSNASPTGNTTIRSLGESVRLLHERERKPAPEHLNISKTINAPSARDPPQRSPLSFRSGFLSLNGKNDEGLRLDSAGHERLSSAASSSPKSIKGRPPVPPANLGKNYEYFTGNTLFWGRGRFQNSRDKPVNIATGILVVLPSALFFAFSYVANWTGI
jgi:palmitoyltransferase ZDHHC9/14/18